MQKMSGKKLLSVVMALIMILSTITVMSATVSADGGFVINDMQETTVPVSENSGVTEGVEVGDTVTLSQGQSISFTLDVKRAGTHKILAYMNASSAKVSLEVNGEEVVSARSCVGGYGTIHHTVGRASFIKGTNIIKLTMASGSGVLSSLKIKNVDLKIGDSETDDINVFDYITAGNEIYYVDGLRAQGASYIRIYSEGVKYNFVTDTNGWYNVSVTGKSATSSSDSRIQLKVNDEAKGDVVVSKSAYETQLYTEKIYLEAGKVNNLFFYVSNGTEATLKTVTLSKTGGEGEVDIDANAETTVLVSDCSDASDDLTVGDTVTLSADQYLKFNIYAKRAGVHKILAYMNSSSAKITLEVNGEDVISEKAALGGYGTIHHTIGRVMLNKGSNIIKVKMVSGSAVITSLKIKNIDLEVEDAEGEQAFNVYDYYTIGNELYYVDAQRGQGYSRAIIYAAGVEYNIVPKVSGFYKISLDAKGRSSSKDSLIALKVDGIEMGSDTAYYSEQGKLNLAESVFLEAGRVNKIFIWSKNQYEADILKLYVTKTAPPAVENDGTQLSLDATKATVLSENVARENPAVLTEGQSIGFELTVKNAGNYKFLANVEKDSNNTTISVKINDKAAENRGFAVSAAYQTLGRAYLNAGKTSITITVVSGTVKFNKLLVSCVDLALEDTEDEQVFAAYDYLYAANEMYYVDGQRRDGYSFEGNTGYSAVYVDVEGPKYSFVPEVSGWYDISALYTKSATATDSTITGVANGTVFGKVSFDSTGNSVGMVKVVGKAYLEAGKSNVVEFRKTDVTGARFFQVMVKKADIMVSFKTLGGDLATEVEEFVDVDVNIGALNKGLPTTMYYAVYKTDSNGVKQLVCADIGGVAAANGEQRFTTFSEIEKEAGYTYSATVFIWDNNFNAITTPYNLP